MSNLKIITGHYGSGKTEFCVNYALGAAKKNSTVLIDIDIVNPYFRSREQKELLQENNVHLVGGSGGLDNLSMDMPALPSEIYGHIDNRYSTVIFDVGGDANGARVLSRYSEQISKRDYDMYLVVNANRPFTSTKQQVLRYLNDINSQSRLNINGLINNTHMLRETSRQDILRGLDLCDEITVQTGIPLIFNVVPNYLNISNDERIIDKLFIIELYMRPQWL